MGTEQNGVNGHMHEKKLPGLVYVASATEQYALVEHFVDRLRAAGIDISYEWTPDYKAGGFKADAKLSDLHRRYIAKMDSQGVREADLVWVVTPELKEHGCGMWVEMGIAVALSKRIVVSGPLCRRTVFSELAEARFHAHDQAFQYIVGQAE